MCGHSGVPDPSPLSWTDSAIQAQRELDTPESRAEETPHTAPKSDREEEHAAPSADSLLFWDRGAEETRSSASGEVPPCGTLRPRKRGTRLII